MDVYVAETGRGIVTNHNLTAVASEVHCRLMPAGAKGLHPSFIISHHMHPPSLSDWCIVISRRCAIRQEEIENKSIRT